MLASRTLGVGSFISTSHTWELEIAYCVIAHTHSAQGLKVNVCHVCTSAFLHVFYVSFMFVFFPCLYVCTYSLCVSFCVCVFNVRVRVCWCPCSLFKVLMFYLEELGVKKSYSEIQPVVATSSCTRMQLWHRLKSYRVWLWGDVSENVRYILTV